VAGSQELEIESELAIDALEVVEADESVSSAPLERGSRAYLLIAVSGLRPDQRGQVELSGALDLVAPDGRIERRIERLLAYQGPLRPFERDDMRLELDLEGDQIARLVFRPSFTLPDPVATTSFVAHLTVQQGSQVAEADRVVTVAGIQGGQAQAGALRLEAIRIAGNRDPAALGGSRFQAGQALYLHASVQGLANSPEGGIRLAVEGRLVSPAGTGPRQRWVTLEQALERPGMPLALQVLLPLSAAGPGAYRVEFWAIDMVSQTTVGHSAAFQLD
jgi:hypothetical protein